MYKSYTGKYGGKKSFWRPRHGWEDDDNKMNLRALGCEDGN
jgi:hypothetical protein